MQAEPVLRAGESGRLQCACQGGTGRHDQPQVPLGGAVAARQAQNLIEQGLGQEFAVIHRDHDGASLLGLLREA